MTDARDDEDLVGDGCDGEEFLNGFHGVELELSR